MDKSKDAPIPDKTSPPPKVEKSQPAPTREGEPQFVRGTIDPPTKK